MNFCDEYCVQQTQNEKTMSYQDILDCTYIHCFQCCSMHTMNHMGGGMYTCEECYREAKPADDENVLMDWSKFGKLMKASAAPKTLIKKACKVLKIEFTQEHIDVYLEQWKQTGAIDW